jgi:hypothetical protein
LYSDSHNFDNSSRKVYVTHIKKNTHAERRNHQIFGMQIMSSRVMASALARRPVPAAIDLKWPASSISSNALHTTWMSTATTPMIMIASFIIDGVRVSGFNWIMVASTPVAGRNQPCLAIPLSIKNENCFRPHKQVMHVQSLTKRVIRMKINAATTCSVCFEEKGRGEGGKWGREGWDWNPSPCMPHDSCQTKAHKPAYVDSKNGSHLL